MNIALHVPAWLLWTLGIGVGVPLVAAILFFAWVGWMFAKSWSHANI